ncbi:MAG: MFS transporter [Desulfobacterales bacterium]|nr:MAG: MFS transporter [Desulfobacterales bacterium]
MDRPEKKIFGTLFFSIFAAVTGVGIVVPLLPIYARNLGARGIYIGMIFGAFSLSRTFFLPYFGRLSDRKGRKRLIVPGLFAYMLISLGFIFSNDLNTLIIIRFFHGIASAMLMPVIQAYIGDITPSGSEGSTMGLFNMSLFCGLSLGPLIGGLINDHFSLQTSFACMGCLALIGFFLCLFLLPPTQSERVIGRRKPPAAWHRLLYDRDIFSLFLFRFAYTLCIGIIWGFLPVLADAELSLSSSSIGILIMLGVLISGALHMPMGFVADRVSKELMMLVGGLIVGAAVFSFEWAQGFGDMVLANVFFGLGGGISMPALMALAVLKGNQTEAMGSVMALLTVAHSLGMLTGALMAGTIMDLFQLRLAFPFGATIMILSVGVFFWGTSTQKRMVSS